MDARLNLFGTDLGVRFAKRFIGAGQVIAQSSLPITVQHLVEIRASQINGCGFCTDMHTKDAAAHGETQLRLNLVAAWRDATVFTEPERAALALAEEATRLADGHDGVSDDTWAAVTKHFDEEQVVALVAQVAMINAFNRMNVIVRNPAGSYEPGMLDHMFS